MVKTPAAAAPPRPPPRPPGAGCWAFRVMKAPAHKAAAQTPVSNVALECWNGMLPPCGPNIVSMFAWDRWDTLAVKWKAGLWREHLTLLRRRTTDERTAREVDTGNGGRSAVCRGCGCGGVAGTAPSGEGTEGCGDGGDHRGGAERGDAAG